jgi:hypothetical protein
VKDSAIKIGVCSIKETSKNDRSPTTLYLTQGESMTTLCTEYFKVVFNRLQVVRRLNDRRLRPLVWTHPTCGCQEERPLTIQFPFGIKPNIVTLSDSLLYSES